MTTLSSPGVQVREFNIDTNIPSVSSSTGGFAGVFQWGPVDQVVLTDIEDDLKAKFWKPSNFNPETWFTVQSFLLYTDACMISRAADTTGNTIASSFSGNSTNLAIQASNNVLKLSNTSNLSVGMKLLFSNAEAVPVGAKIASVNSTAVVLDSSSSANVQSLDVVFREGVTYTAAALQSDLNYDASDISDWDSLVVKNEEDYYNRVSSFDPASLYVARFPGKPGDSLRVCVCDTEEQFSSNTVIAANSQINATASYVTGNVGSNTVTVTITPANTADSNNITAANVVAGSLQASLSVNDLIEVGNTKIGFQYLQIKGISAVGTVGNVYSFTLTCDDEYKLASNVNMTYMSRFWEHYNSLENAPTQSDYVLQFGNTAANDELHVVIVDEGGDFTDSPGTVLEVYKNLSRATDAKSEDGASIYYKNVINTKSQYAWFTNDRTTAVSNTAQFVTSSSATKPLNMRMVGGSSGLNENSVPVGTIALAWDKFRSSEDIDVSLLMQGKARGEAISNKTQLANYIIDNVADLRNPKDCVVFASPDYDDVVNNKNEEVYDVINWANNIRDTSYAFLDCGYKYVYDKYNDVYRWVPLNGDMAGLAARCDLTNDPWWSFAGLNRGQIKGAIRLAWNPRQAERDLLYKNKVNPVISTPNQGIYLYGDKTALSKPSAFDRVNVRRLFIVLEKAIARAAKYSLFDFNDDLTRAQFRNMVNPYLRDVKGRRGIYDFLVICDATNNSPEVIDRNEFIGTILIKPARSINFIQLNFVAVRTGVQFSTVITNF
jgi:hypothetical protein